jgi:hypothetical protein
VLCWLSASFEEDDTRSNDLLRLPCMPVAVPSADDTRRHDLQRSPHSQSWSNKSVKTGLSAAHTQSWTAANVRTTNSFEYRLWVQALARRGELRGERIASERSAAPQTCAALASRSHVSSSSHALTGPQQQDHLRWGRPSGKLLAAECPGSAAVCRHSVSAIDIDLNKMRRYSEEDAGCLRAGAYRWRDDMEADDRHGRVMQTRATSAQHARHASYSASPVRAEQRRPPRHATTAPRQPKPSSEHIMNETESETEPEPEPEPDEKVEAWLAKTAKIYAALNAGRGNRGPAVLPGGGGGAEATAAQAASAQSVQLRRAQAMHVSSSSQACFLQNAIHSKAAQGMSRKLVRRLFAWVWATMVSFFTCLACAFSVPIEAPDQDSDLSDDACSEFEDATHVRSEEEEDSCIHACSEFEDATQTRTLGLYEAQGRLTSARCKMNNSNNANSNNANAAPDLRTHRRLSSWQLHERVALQQAKLKEQEEEERVPRCRERKTSKGPAPEARLRLVSGSGRAKKRDDYYVSTI